MIICSREALEPLVGKYTEREMADILGCSVRSVARGMVRYGFRELKPRPTVPWPVQRRVLILDAEGMPHTFIAAETGLCPERVHAIAGSNPEGTREWKAVWQQIRRDDRLYLLHREIMRSAA
jgi:hypothetical protein